QVVVLECGTNQPGDIAWLADVCRPDVAVFTNIGESHLEKLKTLNGVLKEKWTLCSWMNKKGIIIVNADDPFLAHQARGVKNLKVITYGVKNKSIYQAQKIRIQDNHLCFKVGTKTIELNTCGFNNMYNALSSYACGILMSVSVNDIVSALKHFE